MPTADKQPGPTGERVASAVKALRLARGMTQQQLADAVTEAGRSMAKTGINKLEQPGPRRRRVDTDDLMALAVALDVSPLRLLLPAGPLGRAEQVTETRRARVHDMWRWGRGEQPLPARGSDPDRARRFRTESQPDQQPMGVIEVIRYADELRQIAATVAALEANGIPRATILATVDMVDIPSATDEKGEAHGKR
jgi:transcriptional regulator with XRE-family HTH domain